MAGAASVARSKHDQRLIAASRAAGPQTGIRMSAGLQSPADAASLAMHEVSKSYAALAVLDKVSLIVAPGEFLTLLGPSGSGKTTLLMMIAGFTEPTSGRIMLGARDISRMPPEGRGFGMVFQGYALFPHMTVAENVSFPLRIRRLAKPEIRDRVARALDMVQLAGLSDRRPRQLSGGQQQRVALARALVFEPKLLLLDEPLGALDRKLRVEMQAELKRLHRRIGASFIYVTHDQDEALSMSDRIAVLNGGRLTQVDVPERIYARPATRFVAEFLGESNFLCGTVVRSDGSGFLYEAEGRSLVQSGGATAVRPGEAVMIALRPENIRVSPDQPPNGNALPTRVIDWSYFGSRIKGTLRTAMGSTLTVSIAAGELKTPAPEGSELWASWNADASVPVTGN
ncbi:MAG: ABC transporter ATP-binding protein [Parvibaculaceae bacterium]